MKILVVLCEGSHDVAFLYRLFETIDFKKDSVKIGEMPKPFNEYIANMLKKHNYDDLKLSYIWPPLPSLIMKKAGNKPANQADVLLMLYALGGDSQDEKAKKIINDYSAWFLGKKSEEDASYFTGEHTYAFAYILDANDHGIPERVKKIEGIFSRVLGKRSNDRIDHNKVIKWSDASVGCFIFSGDKKCGRLEDIVYPLMEKDNEPIFMDALKYFKTHHRKEDKCDEKKSTIGIAGQLQCPGESNTIIIRESRYLSGGKICADLKCGEIINFFKKLISL